jgi:3-hydroxyacyl-CoA dehydrogenase
MVAAVPSVPIDRVAVVGAGLVGASWAVVFARAGLAVQVHDAEPAQLPRARACIEASLRALEGAGLLREAVADVLGRIGFHDTLAAALAGAQYVQESIVESLPAKRELFAAMDRAAGGSAILASSTSAFATSSFAADLAGRGRCLVAHPVNPPHLVPFVEVSGAPFTDEAAVRDTIALMARVGQSPINVRREIHGFVLNRLQWTLLAEAYRMVAEGVASAEDIDRAVRDGLGRRWAFMGPFEVGDLNAPDGLADYLGRFGPTIEKIADSRRGEPLRLDPAVTAALHAQLRARWPDSAREQRLLERDRRLLALSAHLSPVAAPDVAPDAVPSSARIKVSKSPKKMEIPT